LLKLISEIDVAISVEKRFCLLSPWGYDFVCITEFILYGFFKLFLFSFDNTGDGTQALEHAREVLYQWSHSLSPFVFILSLRQGSANFA
jgi:hypothetical protein